MHFIIIAIAILTFLTKTAYSCCCEELSFANDRTMRKFYRMSDETIAKDWRTYFDGNKMLKKCGIEYIDMNNIGPAHNKKYTWVTYIGDSLNRALFYNLAPYFSGYDLDDGEQEDLLLLERRIFPLLGPHLGPASDVDVGSKKQV